MSRSPAPTSVKYSIVDAFTSVPFKGNPAAVVILDPSLPFPDTTLQKIAAEFNLSETAYVTPLDPAAGRFSLRWFTPALEVRLCGHATLAAASVLFNPGSLVLPESVRLVEFQTTYSGTLTAQVLPDRRIELEFPAGELTPVEEIRATRIKEVVNDAFGTDRNPGNVAVNFIGAGQGASYLGYLVIEIDAEYDLSNAIVDTDSFRSLCPEYPIVIITQIVRQDGSNSSETFRSRVFSPASGIPEDPVTGSAHSLLGPYWAKRLERDGHSVGKTELFGKQVSARTGDVGMVLDGAVCKLRGNTVLVAKGEMYL